MAKQAYKLTHGRLTIDGVDYLAPATVMLDDGDAATMLAQGTIEAFAPEEPAKADDKGEEKHDAEDPAKAE